MTFNDAGMDEIPVARIGKIIKSIDGNIRIFSGFILVRFNPPLWKFVVEIN